MARTGGAGLDRLSPTRRPLCRTRRGAARRPLCNSRACRWSQGPCCHLAAMGVLCAWTVLRGGSYQRTTPRSSQEHGIALASSHAVSIVGSGKMRTARIGSGAVRYAYVGGTSSCGGSEDSSVEAIVRRIHSLGGPCTMCPKRWPSIQLRYHVRCGVTLDA